MTSAPKEIERLVFRLRLAVEKELNDALPRRWADRVSRGRGLKALFENKKKECFKCPLIGEAINLAKEDAAYYPDKEYGDRLLISTTAQKEDMKDNLRVAKAILDSFPQKKIRIRPHINSAGLKKQN